MYLLLTILFTIKLCAHIDIFKRDPENVVHSNYYDIDQLQTLTFPERNKSLSVF